MFGRPFVWLTSTVGRNYCKVGDADQSFRQILASKTNFVAIVDVQVDRLEVARARTYLLARKQYQALIC